MLRMDATDSYITYKQNDTWKEQTHTLNDRKRMLIYVPLR